MGVLYYVASGENRQAVGIPSPIRVRLKATTGVGRKGTCYHGLSNMPPRVKGVELGGKKYDCFFLSRTR